MTGTPHILFLSSYFETEIDHVGTIMGDSLLIMKPIFTLTFHHYAITNLLDLLFLKIMSFCEVLAPLPTWK